MRPIEGRSQLHRGRILDARHALEPMAPHRIPPPDADRMYRELDSTSVDTLVVSWHKNVLEALAAYPYEAAVLVWPALKQAEVLRPGGPKTNSFGLAPALMPLDLLTVGEVGEAVERPPHGVSSSARARTVSTSIPSRFA
ncbi:hypothetical protein GCM10010260_59050 [Streptomyces filipinensis]|uniref:Uncharacterized protein n=1 Tax=Streptomyces filipinensis TaxID=66887 RepID=A0A918MD11_9ACTN|nr:hypothetical protein [Streptomyces filipinensis]GGV12511.1 hypothetical protein GCM10010260_59050 [Streptomyces filipinensis]